MSTPFIIEKGIPLPAPDGRHGKSGPKFPLTYPWHRFEIGDSVLVPTESVRVSASRWGAQNGVRFVTKQTTKSIRIWRVA